MRGIICSDIHLRPDLPRCRKDADFIETQERHLTFIFDQCHKNKCPLFICGDLFNSATVPDSLKNMFIEVSKGTKVFAIAGQHDLQYHSFKNINGSSFGVLLNSGILSFPDEYGQYANFGEDIQGTKTGIYFWHDLIFESSKTIPPNVRAKTACQLMEELPHAKIIFCGDNHHGFIYEEKGRYVVMCGAINRQSADMIDYVPRIIFADTDKNIYESIPVLDQEELVTDSYLRTAEERDTRISAFVESIRGAKTVNLDFVQNVKDGITANKTMKKVTKDIVLELMEE